MIVCHDLRAGYGRREVLHSLDLTVSRGEMVGLLGPNGSGKTTLLLTLTGVIAPQGGHVLLAGHDLTRLSPRRRARQAAAVPQRADAALDLSVAALVLMGRYPYLSLLGGYGPKDKTVARAVLAETGLAKLADRPCRELSGGEFQRALVARALAQSADILVLDEASANLDVARKVEIYDLLAARNAAGVTVVAALHDINLAALYCRRLLFLKDGRIAADGPVEAVFTQQTLSRIYETDIIVLPHPRTGTPQALVVPGGGAPLPDGPADPGRPNHRHR